MKHYRFKQMLKLLCALLIVSSVKVPTGGSLEAAENETASLIKPAKSIGSGLVLQPPLDLSSFTTEEFVALSSTVGPEKIHKKWTSPVTTLPPHPRADARGLTEQEVKDYMLLVRRLFDAGKFVPISDVGLISTQEDVIRKPMLNHIAAFSNSVVRVYLLVQKTSTDDGWGLYSIVQDLTTVPPLDYFTEIKARRSSSRGRAVTSAIPRDRSPFIRSVKTS